MLNIGSQFKIHRRMSNHRGLKVRWPRLCLPISPADATTTDGCAAGVLSMRAIKNGGGHQQPLLQIISIYTRVISYSLSTIVDTFHVLQVDSIITILLKLLAVWRQSPWRMAVKYYLSPKDDDEAASMHTNMHQNSRHCCISHFASTATSTSSSSAEIY